MAAVPSRYTLLPVVAAPRRYLTQFEDEYAGSRTSSIPPHDLLRNDVAYAGHLSPRFPNHAVLEWNHLGRAGPESGGLKLSGTDVSQYADGGLPTCLGDRGLSARLGLSYHAGVFANDTILFEVPRCLFWHAGLIDALAPFP